MKVLHWCDCGGRCRRVYTRPDGRYAALDDVYHCIECDQIIDTRGSPTKGLTTMGNLIHTQDEDPE